jgi:hypothetical protein
LLASLDHSGVSPLVGLFNHSIPDTAYARCPAAVNEQLRAAIFDPLDIQSKLSYLNANTGDKTGLAFIGDCSRTVGCAITDDELERGDKNVEKRVKVRKAERPLSTQEVR